MEQNSLNNNIVSSSENIPNTKHVSYFNAYLKKNRLLSLVNFITTSAAQCGYEDARLFIVGGFVRDFLLNRSLHDLPDVDIILETDATQFIDKFTSFNSIPAEKFKLHPQFKTATVTLPLDDIDEHEHEHHHHNENNQNHSNNNHNQNQNQNHHHHHHHHHLHSDHLKVQKVELKVDFCTARSETYGSKAELPCVSFDQTMESDLKRRDFTINAMAVQIAPINQFGVLIDLFGGQEDLVNKHIRVLHPLSYNDDPTRIFRAIRFSSRYKYTIRMCLPSYRIRNTLHLALL
jgi:tRNA nucleotidyltransferase/poly(A) polymerase